MDKSSTVLASVFTSAGLVCAWFAYHTNSSTARWILGILSAAILLFTVYATIEAFVKSTQSKKAKKELGERMMKNMERRSKNAAILFQAQRFDDADYGYSLSNPIMTQSIPSTKYYLEALRNANGEKYTWNRYGSIATQIAGIDTLVDKYQMFVNGVPDVVIYVCPYGEFSDHTPNGMTYFH